MKATHKKLLSYVLKTDFQSVWLISGVAIWGGRKHIFLKSGGGGGAGVGGGGVGRAGSSAYVHIYRIGTKDSFLIVIK